MYIVKRISRYNDGSIHVSYFVGFFAYMMRFSCNREYAKIFTSKSDAERICDCILYTKGNSAEIIEL